MSSRTSIFLLALLPGLAACGDDLKDVGGDTGSDDGTATETRGDESGTDGDSEDGDQEGEEEESSASEEEESGADASCGNGEIDIGEACDGDELGGQTCTDLGFVGGELSCNDDCMLDATNCSNQLCGNGVAEGDEECDGLDFGGVNCVDLGFGPGLPMCADDCTFDTSTCPTLGEGESCSFLQQCPEGLNCVGDVCYDGSPDDPCENDGDCQSNDCVGATLFQDGVCS